MIERGIGVPEQCVELRAIIGKYADPDTAGCVQYVAIDIEWFNENIANVLGDCLDGIQASQVGQQNDEFIAALTADRVGFPDTGLQSLATLTISWSP